MDCDAVEWNRGHMCETALIGANLGPINRGQTCESCGAAPLFFSMYRVPSLGDHVFFIVGGVGLLHHTIVVLQLCAPDHGPKTCSDFDWF